VPDKHPQIKRALGRISESAKTALNDPRNVELVNWIGTGPSIRARARFALAIAFVVVLPTLFLAVFRTSDMAQDSRLVQKYNTHWRLLVESRRAGEHLRSSLWHLQAEYLDAQKGLVKVSLDDLRRSTNGVIELLDSDEYGSQIKGLQRQMQELERSIVASSIDFSTIRTMLSALDERFVQLQKTISVQAISKQNEVVSVLSKVNRDQLMLFLLLLLSLPVFLGFAPEWLVIPLLRLRRIEHQVEEGRIREMKVSGRDEVSQVATAVRNALLWREEMDQKKSAKIFEVRNVLRTVITLVEEGVLILDRDSKMNYVNQVAAHMFGHESHEMEGRMLADYVFAPELLNAIQKARMGDSSEANFATSIEVHDGQKIEVWASVGAVHDRTGDVSRVVAVLSRNPVLA
jgi:PAS domain S-box-containing protein